MTHGKLLTAVWFAAEKHSKQRRKNTALTPYINHPIEVAEHLARIGNITDENILIAAILHDTIEDTETSSSEILNRFGAEVLSLVLECTDDKALEKAERKRLQIENAPKKSNGAKLIKIADKKCNLRSILADPPTGWSISRRIEYFDWAAKVVHGLKGMNQQLDSEVEAVLLQGQSQLGFKNDEFG